MSPVRICGVSVIMALGIAIATHSLDRPGQPLPASVGPTSTDTPRPAEVPAADRARIQARFGNLPLSFIENRGQEDERVAYTVRSPGHSAYFTPDGVTLRLTQIHGAAAVAHTIKVELVDAATQRIESRAGAPGVVSYFRGARHEWKTAIPTHASIGYVQPWPGIDLSYRGQGGNLESIFTVAPHGDPAQIKLRYAGHDSLELDEDGNLVCNSSVGEILETAPILYQEIHGQRIPVEGRYALLDENTVAFHVAAYNRDHSLVIDPTLVYAGYIGGSGRDDIGHAIAVDSAGNAYVTGETNATEATFPVAVGPDLTFNGGSRDVFVAKVSADGTALVYAGYIGGTGDPSTGGGNDRGLGIAVDSAGNAYVTGNTGSTEADGFPVTVGPDLTFNGGGRDAFVAKLTADGTALVYAGYLGGGGIDEGHGIAVDSDGNAHVIGETESTQATFPIAVGPDLTFNGGFRDAFVAKVNANGTGLIYAGYIGGDGPDVGHGIAVDSVGDAYVTGNTSSTEATFPVTVGPDLTFSGGDDGDFGGDAFVAKVNADGTGLRYAGYLGGDGTTIGTSIAVDSAGNAYLTGRTGPFFPVVVGPDLTHNGGVPFFDAFVAKVNPAGTALVYSGYIGGDGVDVGTGIAVDSAGNAYVTGQTGSTEATFPVVGGPDLTFNGGVDTFVAKVNPAGTDLIYAGFIGGSGIDTGRGIAVDVAGNAYVTGDSFSTDATFPVTVGPDLTSNGFDAFVAKIAASPPNTAPVANDDTASTSENTAVTIAASTLVANDTDADGDALTLIEVGQGTDGAVAMVGADVVYTPASGFVGADAFPYTVRDPSNATATATVTVTITAMAVDGVLDAAPGTDGPNVDGPPGSGESGGCGCTLGAVPPGPNALGPLLLIAIAVLCFRRKQRPAPGEGATRRRRPPRPARRSAVLGVQRVAPGDEVELVGESGVGGADRAYAVRP